jgi:hypothetical protein
MEHIVPCLRYLTTSDHQMYNVRSLMDAKCKCAMLLMTPFNLLHSFISDSNSRYYSLSSYIEFWPSDVLPRSGPLMSSVLNAGS